MGGRNSLRFKPEVGAHAEIGTVDDQGNFNVEKVALIVDESHSGIGLIVIDDEKFIPGYECQIKIGHIGPVKGRVVWKRTFEEKAARMGIHFLD